MHCPHCGSEAAAQQKFCRSCGMDLQSTQPNDESLAEIVARFNSRREKLKRWGFVITWIGLLLAATLLVVSGILSSLNPEDPTSRLLASAAGEGGLVALLGIGLMLYSRFLPQVVHHAASTSAPTLRQADTTNKLLTPPQVEPTISVTEHTTKSLLPIGVAVRKPSGELRA